MEERQDRAATLLQERLGYHFADRRLLQRALTHSSFVNESPAGGEHNERLEFLGDAVLELCVSAELFARFPDLREGGLTRLRSRLVSCEALAGLARETGLDEAILLGRGEEAQGGRRRAALLCDAMEAVLGAVFLEGGYAAAGRVVGRLYESRWPGEKGPEKTRDNKSRLQEATQELSGGRPVYAFTASSGPEHGKIFAVTMTLPDGRTFSGSGTSIKRAEQDAAGKALCELEKEKRTASEGAEADQARDHRK